MNINDIIEQDWCKIYKEVFSSENGQLVLEHLKRECLYEKNLAGFTDNFGVDPYKTCYNAGLQAVINQIVTLTK